MRRILLVARVSLALHTLVFIVFDRYRELTLNLGALFVHGHDISDIPPVMGAGFGILAIIVIMAGVLFGPLVPFLWQAAQKRRGAFYPLSSAHGPQLKPYGLCPCHSSPPFFSLRV